MRFSILGLTLVSSMAMAQYRGGGAVNVDLPELDANIRIVIGNPERNNNDERIERLERAVFDLQRRLYRLKNNTPRLGNWICYTKDTTAWGKTYRGEASTRIDAEQEARNACVAERHFEMWCDGPVQCEQEVIRR